MSRERLYLDVRTPAEYAQHHLSRSLNIPVDVLPVRLAELGPPSPSREIVVYCRSGRRSAVAAGLLTRAGHRVIDAGSIDAVSVS